jgi:hypothetical protein
LGAGSIGTIADRILVELRAPSIGASNETREADLSAGAGRERAGEGQ